VQDASNKPSAVPVSNGKRQLPSSDNFIFEELSRIDVLKEHQKRDQFAAQESRAPKKGRYSGWVLTASLVLVALQFALFLVAVNPREVIENFKLSVRQWQINLPETGSVTSHGQPPTQDKAAWWKAWQQTFVPDMFSSHHEAPSSGSQTKPHSTEAVK
jgi:hypothetical protein